jgi:hypothetical protein
MEKPSLPAIPDEALPELDFALAPLPPSPLVGLNPKLDHLTKLALAGQTHIAAQLAVSYQLQQQLLTYAMHLRNSAPDELTRKYLDRLIYSLMKIAHQALFETAATAVEQTRALLLSPPSTAEPAFSWKRFWLDPSYTDSDEYRQAVAKKSLWRRLWES